MSNIQLPALNPLLGARIQPRLMKDTYKKVHVYLFDFDLVLGKGSFSKVYKGINLNTNEQVAVKVIEMGSVNTPKLKQLLLQQIDILMKVKHENLIKCFQVLSSSKNTYIIMQLCTYDLGSVCEYIQKQQTLRQQQKFIQSNNTKLFSPVDTAYTSPKHSNNSTQGQGQAHPANEVTKQISSLLSDSINSIDSTKSVEFNQSSEQNHGIQSYNKKPLLKEEKFYPYIKQIFAGLEYLHKENIVHRDLKLSNIFLTPSKACKIGDFGFATIMPSNQSSIKDTCCIGSPLYMSPQSYLQNVYSLKSDIWSFGVLIFQMIYGNPPLWNCPTHDSLKQEIKIPINLKKFEKLATISQDLKQVIQGCLQVDVHKRFSVSDLKDTKLFKKLYFQPLESEVISNIKEYKAIDESNVFVFERTLLRNDSIRPFDIEQFRKNNLSNIESPSKNSNDILSKDREFLTKGNNNKSFLSPTRKQQRCQTINPLQNLSTLSEDIYNNMTDRWNNDNDNRKKLHTKNDSSFNSQRYEQKFRPIDMNSPSMKDRAQSPTFSYRNSEGMQKYLKEMSQKSVRKVDSKKDETKIVTFSDLGKVPVSPKTQQKSCEISSQEKDSPRFASTSNNSFFLSPRYGKNKQDDNTLLSRNYSKTAQSFFKPVKKDENDMISKNYSVLQAGPKSPKQITPYSPRHSHDSSYPYFLKKQDKENAKQEPLLNKNYSVGNFIPASNVNKSYNVNREVPQKYEYKTKALEKCTSSPKFEPIQNDNYLKDNKSIEKYSKFMTTSSYYGSNKTYTPKANQDKSLNNVKQSNDTQPQIKKLQTFTKNYEGANNILSQFSTKMTEHPSQIQKKTYWKGANHKNFTINLGEKQNDENQQEKQSNSLNPSRKNTYVLGTQGNQEDKPLPKKSGFCKQSEVEISSLCQAFKLLNGELIIKDACELIHYTRLLHKLSFTTESNGSSILLLQYSIQILSNLLQKCENFEIKYHYESSTGKATEIREAFKANDCYLSNMIVLNEKQCYAIKKDISLNNSNNQNCNKTFQLKNIILNYMKKYMQRKQALIKLFECNALFENLTSKAKDNGKLVNRNQSRSITTVKISSFSDKGFLNFSKLQKTLQEIDSEIVSKKQNTKELIAQLASKQLGVNSRTLINVALVYIDSISKCVQQKSFMNLTQILKQSLKYVIKNDFELFKNLKGDESSGKSLVQKLIQGFNMDQKNAPKQNGDGQPQKDSLMSKNFSTFVTKSKRLQL